MWTETNKLSCKIIGLSRLILGDRVLFPDKNEPGEIITRESIGEIERFGILFSTGEECSYEQTKPTISGKSSLQTYLLFPEQADQAKIGNWIWHLHRKEAGQVVGITHGSKSQIVIQFKDGEYLITTLNRRAIPSDNEIKESLEFVISELQSDENVKLHVKIKNGIAYLGGQVTHLLKKESLHQFLAKTPGTLAVINHINVVPPHTVSDSEIRSAIELILNHNRHLSQVLNARIEVNKGNVIINGYISNSKLRQNISNQLTSINGVRNLDLLLRVKDELNPEQKNILKQIEKSLGNTPALKISNLHLHHDGQFLTIEGEVSSLIQKNLAKLVAAWGYRNLNIHNNLKVTDSK
jgi:osmotically-inducible protein OsmY